MLSDAPPCGGTAGRVCRVIAWVPTLPWMLAGFLFFGLYGVHQLVALESSSLPALAIVLAGIIGLAGLHGSYRVSRRRSITIETRTAWLIVGIVISLALSGAFTIALRDSGHGSGTVDMILWSAPVGFAALAAEGCMGIGRLRNTQRDIDEVIVTAPDVESLMLAMTMLLLLTVMLVSGV